MADHKVVSLDVMDQAFVMDQETFEQIKKADVICLKGTAENPLLADVFRSLRDRKDLFYHLLVAVAVGDPPGKVSLSNRSAWVQMGTITEAELLIQGLIRALKEEAALPLALYELVSVLGHSRAKGFCYPFQSVCQSLSQNHERPFKIGEGQRQLMIFGGHPEEIECFHERWKTLQCPEAVSTYSSVLRESAPYFSFLRAEKVRST